MAHISQGGRIQDLTKNLEVKLGLQTQKLFNPLYFYPFLRLPGKWKINLIFN